MCNSFQLNPGIRKSTASIYIKGIIICKFKKKCNKKNKMFIKKPTNKTKQQQIKPTLSNTTTTEKKSLKDGTVSFIEWLVLSITCNITELKDYFMVFQSWFCQIFSSTPYRETSECQSLPENTMWGMWAFFFLPWMIKGTFNMKCIMSGDENFFLWQEWLSLYLFQNKKLYFQSFSCRRISVVFS